MNNIIYFIDRDGTIHEGEITDYLEYIDLYEVESGGRRRSMRAEQMFDSREAAERAKEEI